MAETLTIRTASSTEVVKIASVGPQGPKGDKGDPGDVAGLPLSTQGDTLYRGASENERLAIGSTGQVLKVSAQGLPTWANESGAVTSVNGSTGAVTVAVPTASTATPSALGAAAAGTATAYAREDHVHAMPSAADIGAAPATGIDPTAITGTAVVDSDARLSDSRTPTAHKNSHAVGQSDALAPSDIGAQSLFTVQSLSLANGATETLTASRALKVNVSYAGFATPATIRLPNTGVQVGDIIVIAWLGGPSGTSFGPINVEQWNGTAWTSSGLISLKQRDESYRYIATSTTDWQIDRVYTHKHFASDIDSGTLDIARIPTGTGSTQVAIGNHSHELTALAATGATNGHVLTANGSGGVTFAASGGVTSVSGTAPISSSGGATPTISISAATTSAAGSMSSADKVKLDGIASGATANSSDATLLNRANHTGTQAASTITGLATIATSGSASDLTSGTVATARLGTGTADNTTFLRGDQTWAAVSGVTTGSVDNAILRADGTGGSTSQNSDIIIDDATTATQNNVALRNNHSETNSALVLQPKGTGAFIVGPKPDGTSTGGNARGQKAVDLSYQRAAATQVASGQYSMVLGGDRCTSSSTCTIAGGEVCVASSTYAIALGRSNTAQTGAACVAIGGQGNTASGGESFVMGGGTNRASGNSAAVLCGDYGLADRAGLLAQGNGRFAADGDAQWIHMVLRAKTTTNSAVELLINNQRTTNGRLTCPSGKIISGIINIHGVKSDGSSSAHFVRQFQVKNVGGTSSYPYTAATVGTDYASSTSITFNDPDTNGDALSVSVTGIASETWRWTAHVSAVETAYGT